MVGEMLDLSPVQRMKEAPSFGFAVRVGGKLRKYCPVQGDVSRSIVLISTVPLEGNAGCDRDCGHSIREFEMINEILPQLVGSLSGELAHRFHI